MDAREIEAKVSEMLAESKVAYVALYAGATKRDDWECDAWKVAFTKAGPDMIAGDSASFDFYTGLGLRSAPDPKAGFTEPMSDYVRKIHRAAQEKSRKPVTPNAASALYSLVSDADAIGQSFNDWASDLGYDTDSRKALDTFLACQENGLKLRRILGDLAPYREVLADY